jgi:hypothetical protein
MHEHENEIERVDGPERRPEVEERAAVYDAPAAAAGRVDAVGADGMARLQRSAGNAALASAVQRSPVQDVISRPGRSLPDEVRGPLEHGFGRSLAHVQLHDDSSALESARSVQAYAYASGDHIVVPPGAPLETYAEETEHTFQQRSGPVAGTPDGQGHLVSDPSDSFEVAAKSKAGEVVSAAATAPAGPVQRQAEEEELPVQQAQAPVQRQAEEEEMEEPEAAG